MKSTVKKETLLDQFPINNCPSDVCSLFLKPKKLCGCNWCPSKPGHYYAPSGTFPCDVLVVAAAPDPREITHPKSNKARTTHMAFDDTRGKIAKKTISDANPQLDIGYVYATRCTPTENKITKRTMDACAPIFDKTIQKAFKSQYGIIITLGRDACKAVGVPFRNYTDIQGSAIPLKRAGKQLTVFPVTSIEQILAVSGYFATFESEIKRAMERLTEIAERITPGIKDRDRDFDELTKGYIIPKTLEEVREVCDEILASTSTNPKINTPPERWPIVVDTETNTLYPHWGGTKIVCISFAWGKGKAASIGIDHKDTPYDRKEAIKLVKRVLASDKPKVFHNGMYDLKVFKSVGWDVNNWRWDSMYGEHLLEEDKKGEYGLKKLTTRFVPEFAGYEDRLKEALEQAQGDTQVLTIKKAAKRIEKQKKTNVEYQEKVARWETKERERLAENKRRLDQYEKDMATWESVGKPKGKRPKKPRLNKGRKKPKMPPILGKTITWQGGYEKVEYQTLNLYAAIDADITWRLCWQQQQRMSEEDTYYAKKEEYLTKRFRLSRVRKVDPKRVVTDKTPLKKLLVNQVIPVAKVLADMEYRGVTVDRQYARELRDTLVKEKMEAHHKMAAMLLPGSFTQGEEFNPESPKHLIKVLYETGFRRTSGAFQPPYKVAFRSEKTGDPSTDKEALKALQEEHNCPFAEAVLTHRAAKKAIDPFLNNVLLLSEVDRKMHTSYHIVGTSSGRLSSSDENMQNIPKKLAGHNIKKIFVPSQEGLLFCNADASGAEVRVFAAYARDEKLIQALCEGKDVHSVFASTIFDPEIIGHGLSGQAKFEALDAMGMCTERPYTYEDFKARDDLAAALDPVLAAYGGRLAKLRTNVKRVVFGILYGAGKHKIAQTIGISVERADEIIQLLFKMFPTIPDYINKTQWELEQYGIVETYFGRRRRFKVKGASPRLWARAQRQAVNYKIQSTNSDLIMDCLLNLTKHFPEIEAVPLLTVHDSVGFEFPEKYVSQIQDFVDEYCEKFVRDKYPWMPVPFKWDTEVGPNYGELVPPDAYLKGHQLESDLEREEENELVNDLLSD